MSLRQVGLIVLAALGAMAVANYDKLLPHVWHTYTASDGSFSVELPGEPEVETIQAPVEGDGSAPLTVVSAMPTKSTAYALSYAVDENLGRKSSDQVLESARDGSLRKVQGTVISQKRITVQGYPALEMQARGRGDSLIDSRIVVADKRLYILTAVATKSDDREAKTVERMLDSFKIIKR